MFGPSGFSVPRHSHNIFLPDTRETNGNILGLTRVSPHPPRIILDIVGLQKFVYLNLHLVIIENKPLQAPLHSLLLCPNMEHRCYPSVRRLANYPQLTPPNPTPDKKKVTVRKALDARPLIRKPFER